MSEAALEAHFTVRVGRAPSAFELEAQLSLQKGVLVFFGPSGSGKSLTLQAIAGLVRPSSGFIRVRGQTLFDSSRKIDLPAHRRRIGYVPQHHSLFPFLDVAQNVAFGLPRRERREDHPTVRALIEELGLSHLRQARPSQLSGGERQRVALARALAVKPELMLLDEPFASIDRQGRGELGRLLKEALGRHSTPTAFVTHEPEEAWSLADEVVRFERGKTVARGSKEAMLQDGHPVTVEGRLLREAAEASGAFLELELGEVTVRGPSGLDLSRDGQRVRLELRGRWGRG